MKRPTARSPAGAITQWIKDHWKASQWGLMDCDRCPARTQSYPCDTCARWPQLIEAYKRRNP